MTLDQVLEQNNYTIKSCSGATNLANTNDESALISWETCGPDKSMNPDISLDKLKFDQLNEDTVPYKIKFSFEIKTCIHFGRLKL